MILFICTGNTCRSPMAEALARSRGHQAQSAGICARMGDPAAGAACRAVKRRGLSLDHHRARPVTAGMLGEAKAVYAMTRSHAGMLLSLFPQYREKIRILSPEIADPFGGDDAVYEGCIRQIEEALDRAEL